MRRTIGLMIRISMFVSARLGSHWWEIQGDWDDIVDYQIDRVFEPVDDTVSAEDVRGILSDTDKEQSDGR